MGADLSLLTRDRTTFGRESELTALRDLARYNYRLARRHACPSRTYQCRVFRKVWTALLARGLLSRHVPYPFPDTDCRAIGGRAFLAQLVEAYKRSGSRAERMRQRQEAMREAYCGLPRWLLKKVESYVRDDCAMFGYDCSVDARFPEGAGCVTGTSYFGSF